MTKSNQPKAGYALHDLIAALAAQGAHLTPIGRPDAGHVQHYRIRSPAKQADARHAAIAQETVAWLHSRGLIEHCEMGFRLSEAGAAWLRRQMAGAQGFAKQHQIRSERLIGPAGQQQAVVVNAAESPLGWLVSRKDRDGNAMITAYQFEAGERLRADYERARLMPRITANWQGTASSKSGRRGAPRDPAEFSDFVLAARQRVNLALAAVGPELSGILIDVCCHLKGLEEAERGEGWPKRSAKIILCMALTRLARHYGLISDAPPRGSSSRSVLHWGAHDYRPAIDPDV